MSYDGAHDDCDVCQDKHSVTSAHVDLAFDNNATWQDAFQFGVPGDTSWNLVNQSFSMAVQLTHYDSAPLLLLQSVAGTIIIDDTVQRVIHLNVPDTVVQAALAPGQYVYDLVMYDNSTPSIRTPLMHGDVCVAKGITVA